MLRFGDREIAKEIFDAAKRPTKICDVNVDNIVISKLVRTKTTSKYLTVLSLDKAIRPLVLIMSKMSGYVKTSKVKEGKNNLMSFRLDDEKLLEKYKVIWIKTEDLKNIKLNVLPAYGGR